ncbi:MAG TPA: hypothetical protein VF171_01045 [Trueperaceae bacterium]
MRRASNGAVPGEGRAGAHWWFVAATAATDALTALGAAQQPGDAKRDLGRYRGETFRS